jgi:hypothetical protein
LGYKSPKTSEEKTARRRGGSKSLAPPAATGTQHRAYRPRRKSRYVSRQYGYKIILA